MRNPNDVLSSLNKNAKDQSYQYERLYRNFYNSEFFLLAYQNIYANEGNMTAGTDGKTIDGMGMERINKLIDSLKDHSYQPNPAKRQYIKKKNGKMRPLGIPSFDDKLVQEVARLILESIYESNFSSLSHGFRPEKSCHTALMYVQRNFTGVKWFIEGDIKSFFDTIDHQTMVNILRKRINDEYFLGLIWKFLKAGYLEDWTFHNTYSGTPQGSVISPILSNIYLNEFDKYVEEYTEKFNKGKVRAENKDYKKIISKIGRLKNGRYSKENWEQFSDEEKTNAKLHLKGLYDELYKYTRTDPMDEDYRRLVYVRYADDWLCGVIGSKQDAETIKADFKKFLSEKLRLELSDEKTLITNAQDKARFLGYDICAYADGSFIKDKNGRKMRSRNSKIKLLVPHEKWQRKLTDYGALKIKIDENGKEKYQPFHRTNLIRNDDLEILTQYNAEIRGLYNYHRLANNVSVLNTFGYVMKMSMFKTFAAKYRSKVSKIRKKYGRKKFGVNYMTKGGAKTAYFYDNGFRKDRTNIGTKEVDFIPKLYGNTTRTSLVSRIKACQCEWCGMENVELEIHHVRKLKNLQGKKAWEKRMIARKRKTMALCKACHTKLHAGKLD
ncbi:Retron-type RNA-directed DNA polymerase [Dehalobacter sp. UNSWDHB]|uniref:reverse transcriptase/maturase family protein n=1 Tax=Dehalobacter sp. UNSWDHB TaxID=1339256 RepID=UPI00038757A3|nr:reverse transcriptase domain-containing protein [Dehalobacter sp. UNSWDHB]EQB21840.1 Retron-type RNA-directed DNA polymerase [Dehalobacter sp. UNSWDHB]EQB21852.1 Retron-type RNA-directed DNA polymerase [Dehalobacter sp. UNSWDHB]